MKNLGFLILGFATGFLAATLAHKVQEEGKLPDASDLRDQISDRLESLERSFQTT